MIQVFLNRKDAFSHPAHTSDRRVAPDRDVAPFDVPAPLASPRQNGEDSDVLDVELRLTRSDGSSARTQRRDEVDASPGLSFLWDEPDHRPEEPKRSPALSFLGDEPARRPEEPKQSPARFFLTEEPPRREDQPNRSSALSFLTEDGRQDQSNQPTALSFLRDEPVRRASKRDSFKDAFLSAISRLRREPPASPDIDDAEFLASLRLSKREEVEKRPSGGPIVAEDGTTYYLVDDEGRAIL